MSTLVWVTNILPDMKIASTMTIYCKGMTLCSYFVIPHFGWLNIDNFEHANLVASGASCRYCKEINFNASLFIGYLSFCLVLAVPSCMSRCCIGTFLLL